MSSWRSLEIFFTPKNVAVVGASDKSGTIGHTIFENVRKAKIKKCFPVNPHHSSIEGVACYPNVSAIHDRIDLAVIAVPSAAVGTVLEECMEKKARGAVIVSAGFSETGEKESTAHIETLIKKYPHTRVMGPNCVGILNMENHFDTTFFERSRMKKATSGSLSFISQSGALGSMMLDWAASKNFGVNKFVSYGNAMDVDEADLLEYLGNDKKTKVILAYIEGAREGRKFFEIAKKVSRKKPIVVLKGGKNEQTRNATASHTGSLAGSARVYEAVFRQAGIIEADDLLDFFNIARLLEQEPMPRGKRVQIITNGGGFGIVMADQLLKNGLELAKIGEKTKARLSKQMPTATISNPLDLLGDADAKRYKNAVTAALHDPNIDIVVVLVLFTLPTLDVKKIELLEKPGFANRKPLVVVAVGSEYTLKYLQMIEDAGFTTFKYPSVAAKALAEMAGYAQFLREK